MTTTQTQTPTILDRIRDLDLLRAMSTTRDGDTLTHRTYTQDGDTWCVDCGSTEDTVREDYLSGWTVQTLDHLSPSDLQHVAWRPMIVTPDGSRNL